MQRMYYRCNGEAVTSFHTVISSFHCWTRFIQKNVPEFYLRAEKDSNSLSIIMILKNQNSVYSHSDSILNASIRTTKLDRHRSKTSWTIFTATQSESFFLFHPKTVFSPINPILSIFPPQREELYQSPGNYSTVQRLWGNHSQCSLFLFPSTSLLVSDPQLKMKTNPKNKR